MEERVLSSGPLPGAAGALIRPARLDDGDAFARIYAPFVTDTWVSMEVDPPDAQEMARRVIATAQRYPWLAAEHDGAVCGYAYASEYRSRPSYRWSVEVTVYLAPEARGMGLGQRLYDALFAILRAQGFHMAFAGIALPNDASIRLHERMGFKPVGVYPRAGWKLGGWRDVGHWSLEMQPSADPAEPIAWPQLRR